MLSVRKIPFRMLSSRVLRYRKTDILRQIPSALGFQRMATLNPIFRSVVPKTPTTACNLLKSGGKKTTNSNKESL
jgi:hypothetical protein